MTVSSVGQCPSAQAVTDQVRPLLVRHIVTTAGETSEKHVARIVDQGDNYAVELFGATRVIPDPSRNCDERAQIAAVVLALTLEPADGPHHAQEGSEPPLAPVPPAVEEEKRSLFQVEDERHRWAMALGVKAISSFEAYGPDGGPFIGVSWIPSAWVVSLSGSLFPAQRIEVEGGQASLSRYALDWSAGPSVSFSAFVFQVAAGLALDPLVISSEAFGTRQVRLDVGPTASLLLATQRWNLDPFVMLDARWFPRDYELLILPQGQVGRTPQLYLGATLGIRLDRF